MVAPTIKHTFQSLKADGPDSTQIRPSNWNDVHTITLSQAALVGATASGPAVEVPISTNFQFTVGGQFDISNAFATLINGSLQRGGGTMTGTLTLAANPTNALDAATKAYVDAAPGNPTGTMISGFWSTPPAGYLELDGSAVSRTTYAALFAVLGTVGGPGDGTTTFNLPDMRGQFARGWDHGRGVDTGRAIGSTQQDAFQGHIHTTTALRAQAGGGQTSWAGGDNTGVFGAVSDPTADAHSNGTPRTAAETRPKNIAVMFCIKT